MQSIDQENKTISQLSMIQELDLDLLAYSEGGAKEYIETFKEEKGVNIAIEVETIREVNNKKQETNDREK